jgi:hypothetical protein
VESGLYFLPEMTSDDGLGSGEESQIRKI